MSVVLISFELYDLLIEQLKGFVQGLPVSEYPLSRFPQGVRTAIPNNELDIQDDLYLRVNYVPADLPGSCLGAEREYRGVLLVNVVIKRNKGIRDALKLASRLENYFFTGLVMFNTDVTPPLKIKIDRQTNARPPLYESDEVVIPVTINYRSFYHLKES